MKYLKYAYNVLYRNYITTLTMISAKIIKKISVLNQIDINCVELYFILF